MELNTPTLSPEDFVKRWNRVTAGEKQTYQQHFIDVCHLIGAKTPIELDPTGENYTFEYGLKKTDGRQGYADVFYRKLFAIEYKSANKHRDLKAAYQQLQQYRENMDNPPLLIVCDIDRWEIHTNFTNAPATVIAFRNHNLLEPDYLGTLRRVFTNPNAFHPDQNRVQITEDVAAKFKGVVDDLLGRKLDPEHIARYITKLVFCLFVEDVGLLTRKSATVFTEIVNKLRQHPEADELFPRYVRELFTNMALGGSFHLEDIVWFNGSMFKANDEEVVALSSEALHTLYQACEHDWSHVEPSIFGTLFERTLDEGKRAQLGAHYTDPKDIELIVDPVLIEPLRREWDTLQIEAAPSRERYVKAPNAAQKMAAELELTELRTRMLTRVRTIKVLDPACGSGNFLYISLRRLLDLEKVVIISPLWAGLPKEDIKVHPSQLYGMEINEIAHALASVVVWIGYIQWRYENGFFQIKRPILSNMSDNIVRRDAILAYDADGKPIEPDWTPVDVIVGNPPFLGGRRMRLEMDKKYVDDVRKVYEGRISGSADLVTYWFERARKQIEQGKAKRAGLLATNAIRSGDNYHVMERIKKTGNIFMGWSDRKWELEGAAVRVSMVGFDDGSENSKFLDGLPVTNINADLTATLELTGAETLSENQNLCFLGVMKAGSFDIDDATALEFLAQLNASGKSNSDVIKRRVNGSDIVSSKPHKWIIDFGVDMTESQARLYDAPFQYVEEHVKPERFASRNVDLAAKWWLHGRPRPAMRTAIASLSRCIVTPEVSKHRVFVWIDTSIIPDHKLHVFARQDDYFFGVLHSRIHELWTLKLCSWRGEGPSYSSSRTFETFPFPFIPRKEDFSDPRVVAISAAAKALHEERHAWLNPPQPIATANGRTLTNLYNALQVLRGKETTGSIKAAAADFAPRLLELHTALDHAVIAAYGWDVSVLDDDEAILRNLLALNSSRA